jgi:hypothetical protein
MHNEKQPFQCTIPICQIRLVQCVTLSIVREDMSQDAVRSYSDRLLTANRDHMERVRDATGRLRPNEMVLEIFISRTHIHLSEVSHHLASLIKDTLLCCLCKPVASIKDTLLCRLCRPASSNIFSSCAFLEHLPH